jgi:hypothetical protein
MHKFNIYSYSLMDILFGSGFKKQITKNLKILVRLFSSFSSEFASILLEFLLKAINSSDTVELPEDAQIGPSIHTMLDNWKLVITKLSNKEPELLLTLLKAVLDMIETQEAMKNETGNLQFYLYVTSFPRIYSLGHINFSAGKFMMRFAQYFTTLKCIQLRNVLY